MTRARSQKKNSGNQRNAHKSKWPVLILVLLPSIGCALALGYPTQATKVEKTHEAKPMPVPLYVQKAMQNLIRSHPHPAIRNTLDQLIMQGDVWPIYSPMAGILAHEASFSIRPDEHGIMRPIFNYPAEDLLNPQTSKRHKQLVIYHEWIHFEQQRNHRFPAWLAEGTAPVPMPDDMRQIWYESEVDASLAECRLAKELKAESEVGYCQTYSKGGESALRKALAPIYMGVRVQKPR